MEEIADEFAESSPNSTAAASFSTKLDPLDLASIVLESLDTQTDDTVALATKAGLLLSEITRDTHDGHDRQFNSEVDAAAARPLTAALRRSYLDLYTKDFRILSKFNSELTKAAKLIVSDKARQRYVEVEGETGVPWYIVGAFHYREANLNFMGHLHNGDPLMMRTTHVPPKRPPAPWPPGDNRDPRKLWKLSAVDALKPFANIVPGWSFPEMCYAFEAYNGFGYRAQNSRYPTLNSPYLWNYTNKYNFGRYVCGGFPRDRVFDPRYVSKQAGLVAIVAKIKQIDGSIKV
ncbi:hypothetical protein [Mesorhizobium sp.]|uniref:hypothetical protein n=1 Tax=Mesorhizobium sp. TaxID=1871066 RepID=UPI000FE9F6CF|nr:hypothetical protein [Mesorhizobium sp.]RWA81311.1 MAG: hypothetical protein EOQ30_19230 [Mesorhizobium sp.]